MVPLSSVYFVPLGLVACGSPFVAIGIISHRKNTAIRNWPRVNGKIVSSAVQTRTFTDVIAATRAAEVTHTFCSADARFTYDVDGQTHEGTTIRREGISGSQQDVQAWVDRHPPGMEVSVYVDPHDATTAYLEWKRWTVGSIILLVWGGVFVFAGVLVFVIFMLVGG